MSLQTFLHQRIPQFDVNVRETQSLVPMQTCEERGTPACFLRCQTKLMNISDKYGRIIRECRFITATAAAGTLQEGGFGGDVSIDSFD